MMGQVGMAMFARIGWILFQKKGEKFLTVNRRWNSGTSGGRFVKKKLELWWLVLTNFYFLIVDDQLIFHL